MTTPHEHWDELAAGFALDALEPAEEAELLTHLDDCALCREALRDHQLVAASLAALAEDDDLAPPSWAAIRGGIVGMPTPALPTDVVSIAERRDARSRSPRSSVRSPLLSSSSPVSSPSLSPTTAVSPHVRPRSATVAPTRPATSCSSTAAAARAPS